MRHCITGAHNVTQAVEDLTQGMHLLRGIFGHQGKVRGHEGPLVVRYLPAWCLMVRGVLREGVGDGGDAGLMPSRRRAVRYAVAASRRG